MFWEQHPTNVVGTNMWELSHIFPNKTEPAKLLAFFWFLLLNTLSESVLGGHITQHRATKQHGDGKVQRHYHRSGGRADQTSRKHPATDPRVWGTAQHEDETGGWDFHLQGSSGWWRLQVRVIDWCSRKKMDAMELWGWRWTLKSIVAKKNHGLHSQVWQHERQYLQMSFVFCSGSRMHWMSWRPQSNLEQRIVDHPKSKGRTTHNYLWKIIIKHVGLISLRQIWPEDYITYKL